MGYNKCKCGSYTEGDNFVCERCREGEEIEEPVFDDNWLNGLDKVAKKKEKPFDPDEHWSYHFG